MRLKLLFLFLACVVVGCGHTDLKAPCAAVASLDDVPCDKPEPVVGYAFNADAAP